MQTFTNDDDWTAKYRCIEYNLKGRDTIIRLISIFDKYALYGNAGLSLCRTSTKLASTMKKSSYRAIPWHLQILARIRSHFLLKTFGITFFMLAFFAGYIYLLKNPLFPVTIMPLTALDTAIGFKPDTIFLYVSLWPYVSLPPMLQAARRELIYYGSAIGGLCAAGLGCFLFWPTAIPATHIDWGQNYGFSILKGVDAAGNACPSLHVATAVFSAVWLAHQLCEVGAPRPVRAVNWIWCAGIVYSTLATKQHVAVDMVAGAALGVLAARLSLTGLSGLIPKFLKQ